MIEIVWPEAVFDDFVAKATGNANAFTTEFLQDLNNQMIITTPVDLGTLRGSWDASINEPPAGVGNGAKDPSGSSTIAKVNAVAATMTLGDVYYLVNTAVYAARIEYGFFGSDSLGRKYSQPGRGWVRQVVARAYEIAAAAAARVAERAR